MPSLFEHQIHQNIIHTSNMGHSIHINKKSGISLKKFFTWSAVVIIDHVLHAQQSSEIREGDQCWLCAHQLVSLCYIIRWYQLWT